MKTTKRTNRKALTLGTETIKRIDGKILDQVRGGMAEGGLAEPGMNLTEQRHSCNPACIVR